jgi:hypothetical protein
MRDNQEQNKPRKLYRPPYVKKVKIRLDETILIKCKQYPGCNIVIPTGTDPGS